MEGITERTSADRSASSCPDWHRLGPGTEPFEHPQGLESVMTLRVGHPLTRVEAVVMQHQVKALIAGRPAAIVLDVAGLIPIDEMGVLMLSALAREAAEDGIAVALANPSPPLRDRLTQLGVHDLTFIDSPAPTAPTEDAYQQETGGPPASLPPTGPEETTRLTGSGLPPAHAGAGIHHEGLPISVSLLQHFVTASAGAREPASVVAARQLVADAHQARTQGFRRPRRASTAASPSTSGDVHPVVGLAEDSTRSAPNTVTTISPTSTVTAHVTDGEGAGRRRAT